MYNSESGNLSPPVFGDSNHLMDAKDSHIYTNKKSNKKLRNKAEKGASGFYDYS